MSEPFFAALVQEAPGSMIAYAVITQLGALAAFCLPLRGRRSFLHWLPALPAAVLSAVLVEALLSRGLWVQNNWALIPIFLLIQFLALGVTAHSCVDLKWPAALYCGIWISLVSQVESEVWGALSLLSGWMGGFFGALVSGAAVCAAVHFTIARMMPENGTYHIGPRQLSSAFVLGLMFALMFAQMMSWQVSGSQPSSQVLTILLCQFYCVTLLYLQTELFKKSALQKEMNTLNLLYEHQRQQYQVARQNVQIINRKCHELKVRIAELRRLTPEGASQQNLDEAERAARLYDANASTGNEVLDVVLTEKSLLCESRKVQMNAVADGACLKKFEAGDLYALFANTLDYMIENAIYTQERQRRMIDLLVCVRQNFIVINLIGPSRPPEAASHAVDYEQKVVRRIVQKYDGSLSIEDRDGFSAFKIIFPQN